MATIVTRAGKGEPLTHAEVDANFTNLNADKLESGSTVASLDINGGTIDGTVIGGTTAAAISGTTGAFSGDLTVDTNTLFVDASTNRVGIGTSSPLGLLQVEGRIWSNTTSSTAVVGLRTSLNDTAYTVFGDNLNFGLSEFYSFVNPIRVRSPDYIAFQTGGTNERMRIDASGNVGIGTSSPSAALDVVGQIKATSFSGTLQATDVGNATAGLAVGGVGSYVLGSAEVSLAAGATVAGSSVRPVGAYLDGGSNRYTITTGSFRAGTWRCMGQNTTSGSKPLTLYLRIS